MQEPWLVALQLFVRVRKFISIYVVLLAKYSYYKGLKMVFAAGCISLLCQWCCSHQYCWSESPQYWGWCRGEVSMTRFAFWLLDFCWAFYLLSLVLFLFLFFFPSFCSFYREEKLLPFFTTVSQVILKQKLRGQGLAFLVGGGSGNLIISVVQVFPFYCFTCEEPCKCLCSTFKELGWIFTEKESLTYHPWNCL